MENVNVKVGRVNIFKQLEMAVLMKLITMDLFSLVFYLIILAAAKIIQC